MRKKAPFNIIPIGYFELLEPRELLAAEVTFDPGAGIVDIQGSTRADVARIQEIRDRIVVTLQTPSRTIRKAFDVGAVQQIQYRGRDGSDVFINETAVRVDASGGRGRDLLLGGESFDSLTGGRGRDFLDGGSGNDRLVGEGGRDFLRGNLGNDTLEGGPGSDRLEGSGGNDTVDYSNSAGKVFVNLALSFATGEGSDRLTGLVNIIGSRFGDRLTGDSNDNSISGGAGDDLILGKDGNDTLNGGQGDDTIIGGGGNDDINGNSGDDQLFGNRGDDSLFGGPGIDRIHPGPGSDTTNP